MNRSMEELAREFIYIELIVMCCVSTNTSVILKACVIGGCIDSSGLVSGFHTEVVAPKSMMPSGDWSPSYENLSCIP